MGAMEVKEKLVKREKLLTEASWLENEALEKVSASFKKFFPSMKKRMAELSDNWSCKLSEDGKTVLIGLKGWNIKNWPNFINVQLAAKNFVDQWEGIIRIDILLPTSDDRQIYGR